MTTSFAAIVAWGLAIIASFVGWGGAIETVLFRSRTSDAGLRAAWGMAFCIHLFGVLALVSLARGPVIIAVVLIGAAMALFRIRKPLPGLVQRWGGALAFIVLLAAMYAALLQLLGSISDVLFNPNDDYIAYFAFAKQIIQTGTTFDPFSTRHVMSYGGQSFLHAIWLAGAPSFRMHVVDEGICMVIVALLVIGTRKEEESPWPLLLSLLVLLTLPSVRVNTYPENSGLVIFFGLYRTLVWLDERADARGAVAAALVVTMVADAACALRSNYMAVAIPMVALSYATLVFRRRDASTMRETGLAALFGFLFLVPWMWLAYRSSGTPLFPLIHGHFNSAFPMLQNPANWRQELSDLARTTLQNNFLPVFPVFAIIALALPGEGPRRPLRMLVIASLVGYVLLVSALASDVPSFLRYVYGFIVAVPLAVLSRCTLKGSKFERTLQVTAVVVGLLQLYHLSEYAWYRYIAITGRTKFQIMRPIRSPQATPMWRGYQALQQRMPAGAPLLVMVDYPFMFDFARNPIYNIDTAAAVSPPPGLPYFHGAESVASYLRTTHIRYVAIVRPEKAVELYTRRFWLNQLRTPGAFWRLQAPIYLDLIDNMQQLAASYPKLYDDGMIVLIDVSARGDGTPPGRTGGSRTEARTGDRSATRS